MHYSEYAFSKNGEKTIEALDGTSPLGNNDGMTDQDVEDVNRLYQCSGTGGGFRVIFISMKRLTFKYGTLMSVSGWWARILGG